MDEKTHDMHNMLGKLERRAVGMGLIAPSASGRPKFITAIRGQCVWAEPGDLRETGGNCLAAV